MKKKQIRTTDIEVYRNLIKLTHTRNIEFNRISDKALIKLKKTGVVLIDSKNRSITKIKDFSVYKF